MGRRQVHRYSHVDRKGVLAGIVIAGASREGQDTHPTVLCCAQVNLIPMLGLVAMAAQKGAMATLAPQVLFSLGYAFFGFMKKD